MLHGGGRRRGWVHPLLRLVQLLRSPPISTPHPGFHLCSVRDWCEVEQVLGVLAAQRVA